MYVAVTAAVNKKRAEPKPVSRSHHYYARSVLRVRRVRCTASAHLLSRRREESSSTSTGRHCHYCPPSPVTCRRQSEIRVRHRPFPLSFQTVLFTFSESPVRPSCAMTAVDIDRVLVAVGMGRYQFVGCALFGLMLMYSNVSPFTFVFTAGDLKYR